ncbi:MAG TPA: thiol reductant ABC exporter subunit CydD [Kineosporiaceae bacterium]|nr:thiol reductant ABC exporter subunit CydD [Kineosporiaceae bacterium]
MRPLDPRLLRHARAARGYVVLTAVLGAATAALVVVQALLLARVIAGVAMGGLALADVRSPLLLLVVVVTGRAVLSWAQDRYGHRAATRVVAQLRGQVVQRAVRLGPAALEGDAGPALATLATRGLDALDGYLVRYLPQLLLAATVTPAVLVVVWWHDLIAGLTILITLPLVPLFMAMVGWATQAAADRRLRTLQRLGAQVLDLVSGLPTLRALGRETGQAVRVREVGEAYRRATMRTLRAAFLSALVLESLTTLSVALVAVGVGLRLVYNDLDLQTGLAVLILAPEAYLPLRMVGVQYHASVDGLAAAAEAFAVLDRQPPAPGTRQAPDLRTSRIRLDGVGVVHTGRDRATPSWLDLHLQPGEVVALAGPSGVGKSSAVEVLLGLRRPDSGRVVIEPLGPPAPGQDGPRPDAVPLADLRPESWFAQISWVPQRPLIVPGTLADNVRLTRPGATDADLERVAGHCGLAEVVAALPRGWATPLGHGGVGLSAGQRQRLALARALLRPAPLVVLDEPTAHLDAATEQIVHATIGELRDAGHTVLVVAHRPALVALADRVVMVHDGPVPGPDGGGRPAGPAAVDLAGVAR